MKTITGIILGIVFLLGAARAEKADHMIRANAYYNGRDFKKAVEEYKKAAKKDGDNYRAYYMMGNAYYLLGERKECLKAYERLQSSGINGLHYLKGDNLLGSDSDGATDGSHPSDLGFLRQADAFEPILKLALGLAP